MKEEGGSEIGGSMVRDHWWRLRIWWNFYSNDTPLMWTFMVERNEVDYRSGIILKGDDEEPKEYNSL